jgi:diguanylate cyclase (GGDEF)-like protein/PAS domain S-box-containing protein
MPNLTTLFSAGPYALTALSVATILAALAILLLGVGALMRGRGLAVTALFFLVCLVTAGWLAASALMYAAEDEAVAIVWGRVSFLFSALIPAAVFHLAARLVARQKEYRVRVPFFWAGCGAIGATGLLTPLLIPRMRHYPWGFYPAGQTYSGVIIVFFTAIIFSSFYLFWKTYRNAEGKARERAGALLLAVALGSLGMLDYLPSVGIDLQPVGFIATLAFVIVAATALWRFDLSGITPEYAAGQILETMKNAVIVSDMDGRIRVGNRAAETLLGYKPGQLRDAHLRQILERDENLTTGQLISTSGVLEHPMVWKSADGTRVDVLAASSFLRDHHGTPEGVVYVASDYTERRRAEQALRESEHRYRTLFENAYDLVYTHDLNGRLTSINPAGERITGYSREELLGKSIQDLVVSEHLQHGLEQTRRKLDGETESTFYELDILARDGRRVSLELSSRLIRRDGVPVGVQGIARDVTERKASEARYRLLFERNLAGVYRTGTDGRILDCNEACARIFGYESREEFLAEDATDFYFDATERERLVQRLRDQKQMSNCEVRLRKRDGSAIWVLENMNLLENDILEGTIIDVTDRKHALEQMEYQAYHDALTGLPNRLLFRDRVGIALAHAKRNGRASVVMFLDLDQFKHVNDTLGHTVGDRLLQVIGARVATCVRAEDTVARMGGDEFTILLADVPDRKGAIAAAQKVLEAIRHPVMIDEHELFVTTSIGMAMFPDDGEDVESLLKNADRAMYRAKEAGRDNYQFAKATRLEKDKGRFAVERSLHHAIDRNQFVLHYQPMVEIATGRVAGAEALVRWNHPERGLIQPEDFIPAAEELNLIVPLGAWVLRTACAQMKAWHDAGHAWLRVGVNLSPRQFQDPELVTTVETILRETGFPPAYLDLEITESTAMQNVEHSAQLLQRLKTKGIRISIDDFGTGHSSLSYLKRFPIDTVKIDQGFVRDLTKDDAAIISAVISMARALNLRVIAEGVETEEQLAFLRREECSEMQGFLYSAPLAASDFEKALTGGIPGQGRWPVQTPRLTVE